MKYPYPAVPGITRGYGRGFAPAAILMALMLALVLILGACTPDIDRTKSFKTIFDHYRQKEEMVAISFPPGLVGIFLSDTDPDQAELKKLMQQLSSFRMLSVENSAGSAEAANSSPALVDDLRQVVTGFTSRNGFQDLFSMQSGGQDIFLRILENNGEVREAVLMMTADESFFVINLRGNISMEFFTRLAEGGYLQDLASMSDLGF
jgi:hypothetical protein